MINIIVASSLCSTSCVARTRMSNWSIESLGGKPKVNLKAFSFFRLTCKALFFRVIVNSVYLIVDVVIALEQTCITRDLIST